MSSPGPVAPRNSTDPRARVVALMLEPALALAHSMALPLDDLHALVEEGYFREARGRDLSLRAIARRWGSSLHTVARLATATRTSKRRESERLGTRRRVVLAIAARPDATRADLARALRNVPAAELDDALEALVEQGVIARDGEALSISAEHLALLGPDLEQRLVSLRHLLGAVGEAVRARFFHPSNGAVALARVLSFSAARGAIGELASTGYAAVRDRVIEADASAGPGSVPAHAVFVVVERPAASTPER